MCSCRLPKQNQCVVRQLEAIAVYLPAALKKELTEWADEADRSVSYLVNRFIEDSLKERRKQKSQNEGKK